MHPRADVSQRFSIRVARRDDLDNLVALEREAGTRFATVGVDAVAGVGVAAPLDHLPAQQCGRLFVAEHLRGTLLGFVRLELVDDEPHVEQISVRPSASGQGVGAALMDAAETWARAHGHDHMTLCTYRDLPWNGPWYEKLGWRELPDADQGPELRGLRRHERDLGLEERPRRAMVKVLRQR